jgi:hypothetical protein
MNPSTRFSFVDEGEALRRLNIDRDTLLGLVRDGRLRAYPGVGKGNFYRVRDLDALYAELFGGEAGAVEANEEAPAPGKGRPFDPSYKVHVRLQADLKWYDLTDDDLRAWVREMHEDGYPRQRTNITRVIARLNRLVELMDEAAANWRVLQPAQDLQSAAPTAGAPPARRGRNLPMLGGASPSPVTPEPPTPSPPPAPTSRRGKTLPMAGMPTPPGRDDPDK